MFKSGKCCTLGFLQIWLSDAKMQGIAKVWDSRRLDTNATTSWIRTGLGRKLFCSWNLFDIVITKYLHMLITLNVFYTQKKKLPLTQPKLHQQCKFINTWIRSLEKGLLRHCARFRDFVGEMQFLTHWIMRSFGKAFPQISSPLSIPNNLHCV